MQRTTAKEQKRRLIAAELPGEFIRLHGAVVIENHFNMIRPTTERPGISTAALTAFFNSDVADEAFRCINGSVAVSAAELEALPLPAPEQMRQLEALLGAGVSREAIDHAVRLMYLDEARR